MIILEKIGYWIETVLVGYLFRCEKFFKWLWSKVEFTRFGRFVDSLSVDEWVMLYAIVIGITGFIIIVLYLP